MNAYSVVSYREGVVSRGCALQSIANHAMLAKPILGRAPTRCHIFPLFPLYHNITNNPDYFLVCMYVCMYRLGIRHLLTVKYSVVCLMNQCPMVWVDSYHMGCHALIIW